MFQATKEEITRLKGLGIIRDSNSVYASPAFPIKKKNGEIRLVVDYRLLNEKNNEMWISFSWLERTIL
jgi:hypothetical protein